ncbi:PepSY-associated TM helix domain-containing protein [Pollutimonas harenae]|uniref:PepSY domain-containing protein n=1 Tax=Pollutimonas harenae TaxID=657015 RepID=A0A853H476_9BURK|nr:PepSY-associated TM helix domain-containing protein [Pollutimonas harenae]NYT87012.1 PepSY domain-containing protein [Pollutimonas harenae]TEA69232.1 PepSY domain-containing protein [Pollutimonas harenae]
MLIGTRAKRLTYLVHRWTGVAGCLLMVLWFISGVVMLYVGYPKLTPWERLGALPALGSTECCLPADVALARSGVRTPLQSIKLTSVRGQPHYLIREPGGAYRALDARTGQPAAVVNEAAALDAALSFMPSAQVRYDGRVYEDRWTHSRGLDVHRPLHVVRLEGDDPGMLYVSSSTGQVVMDVPQSQQRWNYVGAWLHWLYMFRVQSTDPVWSWLVIVLSAVGTVSAITGICVGLWRWRFSGRYKSGARTPYRAPWMRWHHIIGLLFAGFVFTWILSGLMSMNPLGVFNPELRPNMVVYRGGPPQAQGILADSAAVIERLQEQGLSAVEMEWQRLAGQSYILARDAVGRSRLVMIGAAGELRIRDRWTDAEVMRAASQLLPHTVTTQRHMSEYDNYYYSRHPEAMNGAIERRLPALRLDFDDPGQTRVYIDLHTGDVAASLDRRQRIGRWLFNFLHSWDTPGMLTAAAWRDVVLILLSLGGLLVSVTGVVIAYARLRIWMKAFK